jgi:hypothetical protein
VHGQLSFFKDGSLHQQKEAALNKAGKMSTFKESFASAFSIALSKRSSLRLN